MSARLYGMLPAAGLRVPHGRRYRASRYVSRNEAKGLRERVRVSNPESHPAAGPARCELSLPRRRGLRNSPCEADAVPDLSVLAGIGREPSSVEEDGARILSGHGEGSADSDRGGPGAGGGDARGVSGYVLRVAILP